MRVQPIAASQSRRIVAGLPFVEALARRMAASMPNSIDIGDLVQDGVLGLIDAANRFDVGLLAYHFLQGGDGVIADRLEFLASQFAFLEVGAAKLRDERVDPADDRRRPVEFSRRPSE